jgi:ABC-type taurine transport system ATPase subunit
MSHIFISYFRKDIDFAQRIVAESARAVEAAVKAGLKREAVLRSAFEGRLFNG